MSASALTSWALLIWQELEARQFDAAGVFRSVGLDPAKLLNPVARYPVADMQALWRSVRELTEDEAVGIEVGNRWNPTTFHALGFAWLASDTLGDALHRFSRYGAFLHDGVNYELVADGLQYRFSIRPDPQATCNNSSIAPAQDAAIVALLKMLRMLLGDSYAPVCIDCPHPPNSAGIRLENLARCPVTYQGDAVSFVFDHLDVGRHLPTANSELSRINEEVMVRHLAEQQPDRLAPRVQLVIQQQLPSGNIKEELVASALHLSSRTLQRRLAEEGTSYQELLQSIRRRLAEEYIADNRLAISEVAYLLGFSEQANFTRAFKRWFGVAPSSYRQQEAS